MIAAILSESAQGNLTDAGLLAGVVGAILVPAAKWLRKQIHDAMVAEMRAIKDALVGHQRTLEGIAKNELSQLLPNGGSSMRDQLAEVRDLLKGMNR